MRRGFTSKPCDGCGGSAVRRIATVCQSCQVLMADGRTMRARQDAMLHGMEQCKATTPPHYLYRAYPETERPPRPGDVGREIAALLRELVIAVSQPMVNSNTFDLPSPWARKGEPSAGYDPGVARLLPPGSMEAFGKLDTAIHVALHAWSDEGFFTGTRLVRQLASGETGLAQFNKQTERFR